MKRIIRYLADKPLIFNTLRRIIEANYLSLKTVIKNEFSLHNKNARNYKILDVPCGTGEFCMLFDPEGYHGMDISEKYIDYARRKYKRTFICRNAIQSGFDNYYFDKILILGFLHHLDDSQMTAVLEEAKRILKPDGMLLLIEDAPTKDILNIPGKILQKLDVGSNIRSDTEYKTVLAQDFIVRRYYHVRSGLWDYSVFVLSPKRDSH